MLFRSKSLGNLRNNEPEVILNNEDNEILRKTNLQREANLPMEEHTVKEEKLEIAYSDLIVIKTGLLKLIEINSFNHFPFKNSNLVSFLKGNKWKTIEKNTDRFPCYNSLQYFDRAIINSVFKSMIDKEVEVFFLGMDQYAKLTDLGKEFVNCVGSSNHMDLEADRKSVV